MKVRSNAGRIRGAFAASTVLACVACAAALPSSAAAATCTVTGTTLTFALESGEQATLRVAGQRVGVAGANCQGNPGADEVSNIVVTGVGGAESLTIPDPASLAPGVGAEPGSKAEIELAVDLGAGTDQVTLEGTAAADRFFAGTGGVDVNDDDDADFTLTNVELLVLDGAGGNDTVSGAGDDSTGSRYTGRINAIGGSGDDTIAGGTRNDILLHEPGADLVLGGPGVDTMSYAAATARVVVTVGNRANDGLVGERDHIATDVEVVRGSAFADRLAGHAGRNTLFGLAGNDVIAGGGGIDVLRGGGGNDVLVGGLGFDSLFGDSGADSFLTRDGLVDRLVGGTGIDRSRSDSRDVRLSVERSY